VAQLLRGARGLRVVDDGGGGCRVEVEEEAATAEGRGGDGGLVGGRWRLRAMRWRWHTLRGHVESCERMMDEIGGCMTGRRRAGAGGKSAWRLAPRVIELDTATSKKRSGRRSISVLKRALRMRLDTLGEQHPATASTLTSMGAAHRYMGSHDTAIMLYERALRIKKIHSGCIHTLQATIQNMGAAYCDKGQARRRRLSCSSKRCAYTSARWAGCISNATGAILYMSVAYYKLGDLVKAEELGREAVDIREKTLGQEDKLTKQAREELLIILKAKGKRSGVLK